MSKTTRQGGASVAMWKRLTAAFLALAAAATSPLIAQEAPAETANGSPETALTPVQKAAIASLPKIDGRANPRLHVQRRPSQRIVGTLTAQVTTPSMRVDTWVFITPEPPNLDGQERLEVKPSLPHDVIQDRSPLARPLLRSRVPVDSQGRATSQSYDCQLTMQLYSRSLKPRGRLNTPVTELTPSQREIYLRPDATFDYTNVDFTNWKAQRQLSRTRRESEIDFAQRVFRTITNSYQYLYEPKQDRSASRLCQTDRTDCGGLSILFSTVLRSEAIPARILVGRWAKSAVTKPGVKRDDKFHVIAEFYAEGIGWVPVDGSSAVLHDPTPAKLEFFGSQAGNFVTLHIDNLLTFDTGLWGDHTATFFQVPKFWFRGKGTFDDRTFEHNWTVRSRETPATANSGTKPPAMAGSSHDDQRPFVFLPLTHVRQREQWCAPTSASIVLLRYGMRIPPQKVKQLANAVATDKAFSGTYFKDLVAGLETQGLTWKNRHFPTTPEGFAEGIAVIEQSLRRGYPVIIDTFVPPNGHTVVVNGIDPNRKLVSLVDPNIAAPGIRRLSFVEFERLWRSTIANVRGSILTAPPAR